MADLTTDIYDIEELVNGIKAKYVDIPDDTLSIGIYGYLTDIFSSTIENNLIAAAEYANEAIPTRAKFERNVLCHALSLGINSIRAVPAKMNVFLCIPENILLQNLKNDTFVIDRYLKILLGNNNDYEYRLDYDIIIHHNLLPNGKYVYTATYDMAIEEKNEVTDIRNPYLPAVGIINVGSTNLIAIPTVIRQIQYTEVDKTILVDNPLENKTITFEFEDQLAYFNVMVTEGEKTYYLNPVYDGLTDTSGGYYCNYMYVNEKKIRIKFNRDSYQPRTNATVIVNVYTTKGTECNFEYNSDKIIQMTSDRFDYTSTLYMMIRPISNSIDAKDSDSVDEIRRKIPKQMLLRGSVTTISDLNNYFNFLNSESKRLYFLEKVHNQVERLYYSYLLLKSDNGNIVPTNTINVVIDRDKFSNINLVNYVIKQGTRFYYNPETRICSAILPDTPQAELDRMDKEGFLYFNPFLVLINKNPFFVGFYLNVFSYSKILNFEYINDKCEVQFIAGYINTERLYFTNPDTYTFRIKIEQNISNDFNLIELNDDDEIENCYVDVYLVFYVDKTATRYLKGKIVDYDGSSYSYTFEFTCTTDDIIDKNNRITINGCNLINTEDLAAAYMPGTVEAKLYVLAKLDNEYGRVTDEGVNVDDLIPNLDGYSLSNVYEVYTGIDFFYDYTDIMTSYTTLYQNSAGKLEYSINKMPLIRSKYINSDSRYIGFTKILETNRRYISAVLIFLEDSFGVDFKFFNTYGPSKRYMVDDLTLVDRVNLSLRFELKYVMSTDSYILDDISSFIKDYMEDINELNDLHIPNLITAVTNEFREQLVYFKFLGFNKYDSLTQSIYRDTLNDSEFRESTTVPEFLNVNVTDNEEPDIQYTIIGDINTTNNGN